MQHRGKNGTLEKIEIASSDRLGGQTYARAAEKVAEHLKLGNFDRAYYLITCMDNFACATKAYDEVRYDTEYCTKEFAAGFEYLLRAAEGQLARHIDYAEEGGDA